MRVYKIEFSHAPLPNLGFSFIKYILCSWDEEKGQATTSIGRHVLLEMITKQFDDLWDFIVHNKEGASRNGIPTIS